LKKCKHCGIKSDNGRTYPIGYICSDLCRDAIIKIHNQKEYDKKCQRAYKAKQKKDKDFKTKVVKNDIPKQLKLTQAVFNRLRKLQEFQWFRDRGLEPECISCGKTNMDWCAGHYKSRGSQGALRFDPKNVFLQCNKYCNSSLSGNIEGNKTTRGYKVGLIERFGKEEGQAILDYCEIDRIAKWDGEELIELRKTLAKQIRDLD
jgi:hypothetical protein